MPPQPSGKAVKKAGKAQKNVRATHAAFSSRRGVVGPPILTLLASACVAAGLRTTGRRKTKPLASVCEARRAPPPGQSAIT